MVPNRPQTLRKPELTARAISPYLTINTSALILNTRYVRNVRNAYSELLRTDKFTNPATTERYPQTPHRPTYVVSRQASRRRRYFIPTILRGGGETNGSGLFNEFVLSLRHRQFFPTDIVTTFVTKRDNITRPFITQLFRNGITFFSGHLRPFRAKKVAERNSGTVSDRSRSF